MDLDGNGKLCRLCDEIAANTYNIFEKTTGGKQIISLIRKCLPFVVIYRTDPFTKDICSTCKIKVENYYNFHEKVNQVYRRNLQKLKSKPKNTDIQLYLNVTENDEDSPYTSKSCEKCNKVLQEEKKMELDLINELQDAITESLRKSKQDEDEDNTSVSMSMDSQQLNGEIHENNLDLWPANDADLIEDLNDNFKVTLKRALSKSDLHEPMAKRPKISGPKCKTRPFERVRKKQLVTYEPHSLMVCVLNQINKLNVPDFYSESSQKIVTENEELEVLCYYCDKTFADMNSLAVHEGQRHLKVLVDEKIDTPLFWNPSRQYANVRNKWLKEEQKKRKPPLQQQQKKIVKIEAETDLDDNNSKVHEDCGEELEELLVPIKKSNTENEKKVEETVEYNQEHYGKDNEEEDTKELDKFLSTRGEIVLTNTKATLNGVPLADVPKDDRRFLFKTILVAGYKKKFCPLCRFVFKDSWAIELHYFTSACYYTCKYCGIKFNKNRSAYDDHVSRHQIRGDPISTDIYAARKKNDPVPKVVQKSKIQLVDSTVKLVPKVQPIKEQNKPIQKPNGYDDVPVIASVAIKKEILETNDYQQRVQNCKLPSYDKAKGQSQAYFCRKCYIVFYKIEEFNVHVTNCDGQPVQEPVVMNGTAVSVTPTLKRPQVIAASTPVASRKSVNSESESSSYTSSGRPLRNCVKEVSYSDVSYEAQRSTSNSPARAFDCNFCDCTFPTFQSRNSHMRIHKTEKAAAAAAASTLVNSTTNRRRWKQTTSRSRTKVPSNFNHFYPSGTIKAEPLDVVPPDEPEYNDDDMAPETSSDIVANVSITPISNTNMRINPEIMRLVQNNPNLTIKTNNDHASPSMKNHEQLLEEQQNYKCNICSKQYNSKSLLNMHLRQCRGSKYPCPFCRKRFGTEAAYSSHIFYSHPE